MSATLDYTRRDQVLDGKLELPKQIISLVGKEHLDIMDRFFQALWYNFLKNPEKTTSLVYWSEQFNNDLVFNTFLMHLGKAGWIDSKVEPMRNWADVKLNGSKLLKWVTTEELTNVRQYFKFNNYILDTKGSDNSTSVKTPSCVKTTGLSRPGFAKASHSKFKYDVEMLKAYIEPITMNVTKSMRMLDLCSDMIDDKTSYAEISKHIVDFYIDTDGEYTLGKCLLDQRGRAIYNALGKVFNPISFKDARALLVTPESYSDINLDYVYRFIAELLGYKPSTIEEKTQLGIDAYENRTLHDIDLDTEDGRAELHENIWLERLYDMLDNYDGTNWNVPIERDYTASMLCIEGTLLAHKPFLDMTNIIGTELKDAWSFDGIPRTMFKKAMTPLLYGSSQSCQTLWAKGKFDFTNEQVVAFNREITSGAMAVADKFKEFIINNVKPQETMTVNIWGETFTIRSNRYRNVGDYAKTYEIYSSLSDSVVKIAHMNTHREPDMVQFKRFFVTLLVHNLDSQLMDYICQGLDWSIPIHDAIIIIPTVKNIVAVNFRHKSMFRKMYNDRHQILKDYFDSIGITGSQAMLQWNDLKKVIQPLDEEFRPQASALK